MASNDEERSVLTIFTTAGQNLAARVFAGTTTVQFTKAQISTTNLFNDSKTEIQVLTSLDNVQQNAEINGVTVINDNTVDVSVAIDQTKAPNDYQMNSVGLYGKDGDGKEYLYSVTVLKDPVYVHQDAAGSALGIDLETVVGQSKGVVISINPAGAVTNEILKATLADYVKTDDVKSLIPDTVIDGSKPADFKESVTLEKGAVDGAGNAIATTKDLADGDATTLKSAKEYADAANKSKLSIDDQLGGTNLLLNSKFDNGMDHWNNWGDSTGGTVELIAGTSNWDNRATTLLHVKKPNSSAYLGVAQVKVSVAPNSQYTLSLYRTGQGPIFMQSGSGDTDPYQHTVIPQGSGEVTFTFTTGATRTTNIYVGVGDGYTGDIYISLIKLERGATHSDWSPAPEDKADASEVAPLTVGVIHDGADMDKEFTPGSYFSKNAVIHGPGFPNGDVMLTWDVSAVTSNADEATAYVQTAYDQPGDTAVRNFVSGAGWGPWITMADNAKVVPRDPNTGTVSKPTDFTNLTVNGGKSVATRDDLKSLEASTWRPLTLENSQHGVVLFKDNGDGTASLTGSATFIIGKGKTTFFPIIIPPVGYTFTSLKWTKGTDNNGVYAISGMTGSSAGTTNVVTAGLSNGNICFGGGIDGSYAVTFSPSELTTLSSGINCNPALVSISKV